MTRQEREKHGRRNARAATAALAAVKKEHNARCRAKGHPACELCNREPVICELKKVDWKHADAERERFRLALQEPDAKTPAWFSRHCLEKNGAPDLTVPSSCMTAAGREQIAAVKEGAKRGRRLKKALQTGAKLQEAQAEPDKGSEAWHRRHHIPMPDDDVPVRGVWPTLAECEEPWTKSYGMRGRGYDLFEGGLTAEDTAVGSVHPDALTAHTDAARRIAGK